MQIEELQKDIVRLQVQVENLEKADVRLESKVDDRIDKLETKIDKKIDSLELKVDGRIDGLEKTLLEIKEIVLMSKGSYKTLAIIGGIVLAVAVAAMKFIQ